MFLDRTEIALKLKVSKNTIDRIAYYGNLEYQIKDGKKYLKWGDVVEAIKKGRYGRTK